MDLIIVFIVFSIIMNIIGTVKKQNKRQTVRRTAKFTASGRRDFKSLIENEIFSLPKKPVPQKVKESENVKTSLLTADKAGHIHFKDIKKPMETITVSTGSQKLKSSPFVDMTDMQRAIVMAEVLAKPKALRR